MLRVHPIPKELRGNTCVLIDVLRATSTIATFLYAGAESVRPVRTVEQALELRKFGYTVAGERGGLPPEGFDLGNSPTEVLGMKLEGVKIALTTSNGTMALSGMNCREVIAASFLNLSAVVEFLKRRRDVDVVCAGKNGEFSLEDFLLAGFISSRIGGEKNDAALVAQSYALSIEDVHSEILRSSHAKELVELGFEEDVEFCSRVDEFDIVPVLKNGEFRV